MSNSLLPTSYIKMIEFYLIFTLLVPCLEVLMHTLMDSLRLSVPPTTVAITDCLLGTTKGHTALMSRR